MLLCILIFFSLNHHVLNKLYMCLQICICLEICTQVISITSFVHWYIFVYSNFFVLFACRLLHQFECIRWKFICCFFAGWKVLYVSLLEGDPVLSPVRHAWRTTQSSVLCDMLGGRPSPQSGATCLEGDPVLSPVRHAGTLAGLGRKSARSYSCGPCVAGWDR